MKISRTSLYWLIGLISTELIVLLSTIFVLDKITVSTIFFGITAALLVVILIQWGFFKNLNSKIKHNKIYQDSGDEKIMHFYNPSATKDSKGKYSEEDIIDARRSQGWSLIKVIMLPILLSLSICLILAFI